MNNLFTEKEIKIAVSNKKMFLTWSKKDTNENYIEI